VQRTQAIEAIEIELVERASSARSVTSTPRRRVHESRRHRARMCVEPLEDRASSSTNGRSWLRLAEFSISSQVSSEHSRHLLERRTTPRPLSRPAPNATAWTTTPSARSPSDLHRAAQRTIDFS